jgi:hypothetical protein
VDDSLKNELRKLGLRVRPREIERAAPGPGQVAFDDRGNAVYEWRDDLLKADTEEAERARRRALAHPGLAIVDDDPAPNAAIRTNAKGLRLGYDPYESGLLPRKPTSKRRNLRELSKWIEMKRRLAKE